MLQGFSNLMITIAEDDPRDPEVIRLLEAHLTLMRSLSPPESVHALDLDELCTPDITFWSIRSDDKVVGCAALKVLTPTHGEIKSMHVAHNQRGSGIANRMVEEVLAKAGAMGLERLSLETGSNDAFLPARSLYERHGFSETGPFGDYEPDPHSTFMTRTLP